MLGFVIGVIQCFLVELLGAELIPGIGFHEAVDLPGSCILLHEFLLLPGLLLLHLPGQVDAVFSRFIDRHDLRPHQVDIGAGGFFIRQDMCFRLLRMHLNGKEAAVAASVHGQEIHFVGGAGKYALPQMIGSVAVIGKLVGILAPGEKGLDVLDALRVGCRYHLRHFHDPVPCQSLINLFIVQLFQIIGKPFVPDSQEAKERRFPRSLTAGQHQHQIKFRSRLKDTLHSSQHEQLEAGFIVIVDLRSQKMMQRIPDPIVTIPPQLSQIVPDRMKAMSAGHHPEGVLHTFF